MDIDESSSESVYTALYSAFIWSDAIAVHVLCSGDILHRELHTASFSSSAMQPLALTMGSIRSAALSYQLLQIGITPVRFVQKDNKVSFEARPFNVYVFPREFSNKVTLSSEKMQWNPEMIARLAEMKFDFNRTFLRGLPYLTVADEVLARVESTDKIDEKKAASPSKATQNNVNRRIVPNDPRDKLFVAFADLLLARFVETKQARDAVEFARAREEVTSGKLANLLEFNENPAENSLLLTAANSYLRRLLHQSMAEHECIRSRKVIGADTRRPTLNVIIFEGSKEEIENLERERLDNLRKKAEDRVQKAIGLRNILERLCKADKMIIGDNIIESLMMMEKVFEGEFPNTFSTLKQALHHRFGNVYDVAQIRKSTEATQQDVTDAVCHLAADEFNRYSSPPSSLEAGYLSLHTTKSLCAIYNSIDSSSTFQEWLSNHRNRVLLENKSLSLESSSGNNAADSDRMRVDADADSDAALNIYVATMTSPHPSHLDQLSKSLPDSLFSIEAHTMNSLFIRIIKDRAASLATLEQMCSGIGDDDGRLALISYTEFVAKANAAPYTNTASSKRPRR